MAGDGIIEFMKKVGMRTRRKMVRQALLVY